MKAAVKEEEKPVEAGSQEEEEIKMTRCPKCGKANDADSEFCEECSTPLNRKVKTQQKNVTLATFLPLLIGVLLTYISLIIKSFLVSGGGNYCCINLRRLAGLPIYAVVYV